MPSAQCRRGERPSFDLATADPSKATGGGIAAAGTVSLRNATVSDNIFRRGSTDPVGTPATRASGVSAAAVQLVASTLTGNVVLDAWTGHRGDAGRGVRHDPGGTLTARGSVVVPIEGTRSCAAGIAPAGTSAYSGDETCAGTGTGTGTGTGRQPTPWRSSS